MSYPLVALVAYLVGSLPFGYLAGRARGIDVRRAGSGNIGATNVSRLLGKKWGAAVLLFDGLKGLLPTLLLPMWLSKNESSHAAVLAGVSAILGHMFPVWLKFHGGKGVATALGAAAVLAPYATLAATAAFIVLYAWKRIVSLGSIVAAVVFAALQMFLLRPNPFSSELWSVGAFSLAVPALILVRHRTNIARLIRGEERPLPSAPP